MYTELTVDELRNVIKDGKYYQLCEDLIESGRVYIGRERILTLRDVNRLENKLYGKIKVKERTKLVTIDDNTKKLVKDEIEKIFKEEKLLKGMLYAKKKKTKQVIINLLPHNDYIVLKAYKLLKFSRKLFTHSVLVGIMSLVVDCAWQERHNNGLIDSLRSEHLWYGALLHDIGLTMMDKSNVDKKLIDIEDNEAYRKHPDIGYKLLNQEQKVSELPPEVLRIVLEHEETLDGNGYPNNLSTKDIHPYSQVISVVEEFIGLVMGELTQGQRPFTQVIRRLMAQQSKYDKKLINIIFEQFKYLE